MKKPHIVFAGKPYGIDSIRKETKASPIISVTANDIKVDETLVVTMGEDSGKEIVLYKHEGVMVVLLGFEKARKELSEKGMIRGRLLSKQGLKHVAVIDIPMHEQNKQAQAIEQELYLARQQELKQRFGENYRSDRPQRPNDGFGKMSERVSIPLQDNESQGYSRKSSRPV